MYARTWRRRSGGASGTRWAIRLRMADDGPPVCDAARRLPPLLPNPLPNIDLNARRRLPAGPARTRPRDPRHPLKAIEDRGGDEAAAGRIDMAVAAAALLM